MSNTMDRVTKAQKNASKMLDRISKSRTKLVARLPFFGHLALKLRPRLVRDEDGVSTAAVAPDGTLIVNAAFADKLNDPQLCFVVCHEVLHPAMLYFDRMQGRIPRLWNIAHDYAINLIIKHMADANIQLLEDCLCDEKYREMSAEEIYDDLLKDAVMVNIAQGCPTCGGTGQAQPGQGQPQQGQGQGQPQQGQGQPGQGQGQGQGGNPCPDCGGKGSQGGQGGQGGKGKGNNPLNDPLFGDGREDLADSDDGKKAAQGDKAAKNRINTDWKISIVAAAQRHERQKGRGSLPGGLQRLIDEFMDPKVDWREQLSRWVGENGRRQDYSYSRPSRRSESVGQYMPSLRKFGVADVTVMVDTSGSIGDRMLKEGLAEIQGVCEDLGIGVRAMIIDAAIHDDVEVEDAYELAEKLSGGGGSDFRPAFDRLHEEGYDGVVIAFTDGDIAVPYDKPTALKGVLWCIYEGCHSPTEVYGQTIEIPREAS
ncbi:MAG TPA: VWA-like domain-containing protein [Anaerolineae bacterium]|nr:VWA-like domain-containing protein [Anaerolineae bacterium]